MICKCCKIDKPIEEMKPYRKRNGEISHRKTCKTCYNRWNNGLESTQKARKNRKRATARNNYVEVDSTTLHFITYTSRCWYYVSNCGIIYVKNNLGFREVEKRLGSRGYLEFKIGNKSANYKRVVAEKLVPNDCEGNFVYSKNGNVFDTRPENLKWVWTRNGRNLSFEDWKKRFKDKRLAEYAHSGNKRHLLRAINNHFEKIYPLLKPEFLGDLYLKLTEYAERNLIFHLTHDSKQAYLGLIKQSHRKKIKTFSLDSIESIDKTNLLYERNY